MARTLNGFAINGGGTASWFRSATAIATATAVAVAPVGVRTTFGAASGTATANGLDTPTRIIHGAAFASAASVGTAFGFEHESGIAIGIASSASYAGPQLTEAAQAQATTDSFGRAAVLRYVYAQASADATSSGIAIPASLLGTAAGSVESTVVSCVAYVVQHGSVDGAQASSGAVDGATVTRGAKASALASSTGLAEASYQAAGTSFKRNDGWATGYAQSTATVLDNETIVLVTLGSFAFTTSDGVADAHLIQHAAASNLEATSAGAVTAHYVYAGEAVGLAQCAGRAAPVRTAFGSVSTIASCTALPVRGIEIDAGRVLTTGLSTGSATPLRTTHATARGAAASTGTATPASFWRMSASGVATATAVSVSAFVWRRWWGMATGAATSSVVRAAPLVARLGSSSAFAMSTGSALAFLDSDVRAPDERQMQVPADDRGLVVASDDRTMEVL